VSSSTISFSQRYQIESARNIYRPPQLSNCSSNIRDNVCMKYEFSSFYIIIDRAPDAMLFSINKKEKEKKICIRDTLLPLFSQYRLYHLRPGFSPLLKRMKVRQFHRFTSRDFTPHLRPPLRAPARLPAPPSLCSPTRGVRMLLGPTLPQTSFPSAILRLHPLFSRTA
jgi:hypothetical protein